MTFDLMKAASSHQGFDLFWLSYLKAHRHPINRLCHFLGTLFGILAGILVCVFISPTLGAVMIISGIAVALVGHFVFEGNSPRGGRPLLGMMCDLLMLYLFLFDRSTLKKQLARE